MQGSTHHGVSERRSRERRALRDVSGWRSMCGWMASSDYQRVCQQLDWRVDSVRWRCMCEYAWVCDNVCVPVQASQENKCNGHTHATSS